MSFAERSLSGYAVVTGCTHQRAVEKDEIRAGSIAQFSFNRLPIGKRVLNRFAVVSLINENEFAASERTRRKPVFERELLGERRLRVIYREDLVTGRFQRAARQSKRSCSLRIGRISLRHRKLFNHRVGTVHRESTAVADRKIGDRQIFVIGRSSDCTVRIDNEVGNGGVLTSKRNRGSLIGRAARNGQGVGNVKFGRASN